MIELLTYLCIGWLVLGMICLVPMVILMHNAPLAHEGPNGLVIDEPESRRTE